jgi:hypothetical protein
VDFWFPLLVYCAFIEFWLWRIHDLLNLRGKTQLEKVRRENRGKKFVLILSAI